MSFKATLMRHQTMIEALAALEPAVEQARSMIQATFEQRGKLLLFGNGGSAADAQHLATEFVVRYHHERAPLAAIALTTDTSILTAHANDYQFDTVFDRQIRALARPGDLAIGLSTSGNSANVINGLKTAKSLQCRTIAFTGAGGGALASIVDLCLQVPSSETARIQEGHLVIGHWLCEAFEPPV